jgi:hypothetical protein
MEYTVGITLALAISLAGTIIGFDRDRAFYPIMAVVVASYYDLFAIIGGSGQALTLELIGFLLFAVLAVIGFKSNLWLVVGALAGHGIFDVFHADLITNPGVPSWWPMFCLTYDVSAAVYLAASLWVSRISALRRDAA